MDRVIEIHGHEIRRIPTAGSYEECFDAMRKEFANRREDEGWACLVECDTFEVGNITEDLRGEPVEDAWVERPQ